MILNSRKTISISFVILLGVGVGFSQDSWKQIESFPAQGRTFATGFSFGLNGFVGLGEGDSLLNDFYSVSFVDNTWRKVSAFPGSARKGAVSFVLNGYAYVGLGVSESGYKRDFWKYNPINDSWQETASFPGTGRAYAVADTFGGDGYVLTGVDSTGYPTDVWRYDASEDRWEEMNAFNGLGRTNAYIFSINNTLYVGNGYQGSSFKNSGYKYISSSDSWEELGVFSGTLRQGTSYASANNKGYFGLGYNGHEWSVFDPETEEWSQTTDYGDNEESNVGGATALALQNRIYVVGGYKSTSLLDGENVQDVFKFSPEMELPSECTGYNYNQSNARSVQVNFYGDEEFEDASKFLVRKKENDGNWVIVDTIKSGFFYVDTTLLEDSYYSYAVAAYNANGIADFVLGSSVHTFNYIESPRQFALIKDEYNDIHMSWKDMSSDEDAYIIEMKINEEDNFNVVATLPQNSESYLFQNPQKEIIYQFRIITYSDVLENDTSEIKPIAFTEPGRWVVTSNFPGTGRAQACTFTLGGKAYMGLGSDENGTFLKDFWQFDASTNEWVQLNDFAGVARAGAVAFSIGEFAYVGTGNNSDSLLCDFWSYNPVDDSWTQIEDFGGGKRTRAASFALKNAGYVGYGTSERYSTTGVDDFWKYDPSSNTWIEAANITLTNEIGATCFAIADTGYLIAGKSPYTLFAYHPDNDEWVEKNILNSHFDYMSASYAFVVNDKAYISGGAGYYYNVYGLYSRDTWEYDPVKNQFFYCADMEFYQYNHITFALDGKGYSFTGNVIDDFGYGYSTAKAQVFYPDSIPVFPKPTIKWEEDKLVVQWNDISFSENGYNLYRSYGKDEYQLLAALPEDSVSYDDKNFSMGELDTINYKVEVVWNDKATKSEAMIMRPLNAPEIISMEVVSYNEVDITIKKTSLYAEAVLIYRQKKNGYWGSSLYYEYESYMDEIEDTVITIHYHDITLDEAELINFRAENILNGEVYSFYSAMAEFGGVYSLLKHPVIDTMVRTDNEIELIWTLQSEYADSVSIKRKTIGGSSEPELIAVVLASDTTYNDSFVTPGEDYIYYLESYNDSLVSKETEFNTYVYTHAQPDELESIISVYPNPVSEELYIDLPQDCQNAKVTLRIYTSTGKLIEQKIINNTSRIKLSIGHLTNGIYLAEISVKGKKQFTKIIKE